MFLRYTPFGVGHPATVRRITRDCLRSEAPADTMDVDYEGVSDSEGLEEFDDEQEESDYASSDEDLGDEDEGGDGDDFDDLSF